MGAHLARLEMKICISEFLRRILFEIPPGRPEKSRDAVEDTDPNDPTAAKPERWRGAVLLDSAALDVPVIMNNRHLGLYDHAFGTDPRQWTAVSPIAQLASRTAPMLAVCSSRRRESCGQADRFAAKASGLGGQVRVLREDLSHMEINATLGAASDYTSQVDAFLQSLR